ncbi:hypothetical protein IK146_00570 [Candidatus Saccharibacteria bacterium]|nr:hypothetical protein [Candidatus Saccharibacteria bacterium]
MQNDQLGTPPDGPGGQGQAPATNATYSGATTLTSETTGFNVGEDGLASTVGGQNALLVTGGEFNLSDTKITKSGDEASEESDFYGTNAAVLITDGALTLSDSQVDTSGAHANGIFAYGNGNATISNTAITTTNNNSGGIMVAGGGKLSATGSTVETKGNSSAAIRSDRGGGTIEIFGGDYTTHGQGSPAIYSTASITVSDAELTSTSSEGVVIEGSNSVNLSHVTLTDTNNTLNGNSETYKNIFIYQSMSGDASEGTGTFQANESTITTNQGDTFFVTNATANIRLTDNRIINNDATSAFLRAQAGKWGTAGSNGGHVNLTLNQQVAEGDIVLDSLSTLTLVLENSSFYMGAINSGNTAQTISVNIDASSQLILAGDTYISELTNAMPDNMNIYSNGGHKLYVAGEEIAINGSEAPEVPEVTIDKEEEPIMETVVEDTTGASGTDIVPFVVGGVAILVIVLAVVALFLHNKKKKGPTTSIDEVVVDPTITSSGRPDFSQFDDGPVPQGEGYIPPAAPASPTPATPATPVTPPTSVTSSPTAPSSTDTHRPLVGQM